MKSLSPTLRNAAVGAVAILCFSAGTAISQVDAPAPAPLPPPEGQTVIVVPPGTAPPPVVESVPVPPPEPKKKGFFGRLFGGSDNKNKRENKDDNDDDGDSKRAPKAETVIEEVPPGPGPIAVQPGFAPAPAPNGTLRQEPGRKMTRRTNEVPVPSSSTKTRVELPPPGGVVTETLPPATPPPAVRTVPATTEVQRVPPSSTTTRTTTREVPGQAAVTASSTASAPLPVDQSTLEQARAKTEMNKVLAPPDVAVATQQQTTTEPAPSQDVVVKPQTPTTVDAPPATVEQQRALAETKKELARLRGEMATVKEELKSTQRSSPAVDLNKVTIAAPNEAAPITPPEPPDAAATPTKAASVAGSEAPTDKTVVKPAEPPGGLTSPPPGPVVGKSDSITIGTSAAKESGTPTAAAGSPEADASNGTPTGTKTDSPDFVRSPFPPHNKLDVKGMRPGSLAKDPTNGKVFRVP